MKKNAMLQRLKSMRSHWVLRRHFPTKCLRYQRLVMLWSKREGAKDKKKGEERTELNESSVDGGK